MGTDILFASFTYFLSNSTLMHVNRCWVFNCKLCELMCYIEIGWHSTVKVIVTQSCPTFCDPMDCIARHAPISIEFSRQEYWSVWPFQSPGDLPDPEIKPRSPALQADSLPAESKGKSKNTGVGSLFLLQGIFPTQESNWDFLHCKRILYQLSYEGSP